MFLLHEHSKFIEKLSSPSNSLDKAHAYGFWTQSDFRTDSRLASQRKCANNSSGTRHARRAQPKQSAGARGRSAVDSPSWAAGAASAAAAGGGGSVGTQRRGFLRDAFAAVADVGGQANPPRLSPPSPNPPTCPHPDLAALSTREAGMRPEQPRAPCRAGRGCAEHGAARWRRRIAAQRRRGGGGEPAARRG